MELHVGKLTADRRSGRGKGVARKLRQKGLIPAVLYGEGGQSEALISDPTELHLALDPEKLVNTVIELTIRGGDEGKEIREKALLKEHQIDALSRTVLHVDFIRVSANKPVRVEVPIELTGRPVGVQLGGVLNQVFRALEVECTPDKIPTKFLADVSELELGDTLEVSDLAVPEGVRVCLPDNQTLAAVVSPKAVAEEEEAEEAEAAAEGAEAPAAEGAAKEAPAKEEAAAKK